MTFWLKKFISNFLIQSKTHLRPLTTPIIWMGYLHQECTALYGQLHSHQRGTTIVIAIATWDCSGNN